MGSPPRALLRKRTEIAHELSIVQGKADALREQLNHVECSIRLFDPDFKPAKTKPRKPPTRHNRLAHGEAAMLSLAALRDAAKPLSTPEIVTYIAKKRGLAFRSRTDQEDFASSVAMALGRYKRKGIVERVGGKGARGEYRWALAGAA